jgi:hypothetical protein
VGTGFSKESRHNWMHFQMSEHFTIKQCEEFQKKHLLDIITYQQKNARSGFTFYIKLGNQTTGNYKTRKEALEELMLTEWAQ